ncbi:MAG: hypothetical protein J0H08_04285 [Rhizobiales bacterium]|jgi:hypothetical protein|nr:hypothetical protein [Hyphomicrobiales bacterium]
MQGLIFERGIIDFLLVTCFLGGGAAFLTGRAVALTWRPTIYLVLYLALLACAVRFIHYALFEGTLLSLHYLLVDVVVLFALGWLGFQMTRARQMAGQYSWLYRRSGPVSWRLK